MQYQEILSTQCSMQIVQASSMSHAALQKEWEIIRQMRAKVARQRIQDAIHKHEIAWQDTGTDPLYRHYAYNGYRILPYVYVPASLA